MKISKVFSASLAISALAFSVSSFAIPISLNVANIIDASGNTGSTGEVTGTDIMIGNILVNAIPPVFPTVEAYLVSLGKDINTETSIFDAAIFGIDPADDLTTINGGSINTLQLGATGLLANDGQAGVEGIGVGMSNISFDINWDSALSTINFTYSDAEASIVNAVIARGDITSLTETSLVANFNYFAVGVWFDANGNDLSDIDFALEAPIVVALSVQAGGQSVDILFGVPEPSVIALIGLGLMGMGAVSRRRQKRFKI